MKSTILILAITVATTVVSANSIQNRELSNRGILIGGIQDILDCLINLLTGVSEEYLQPVLEEVVAIVNNLGVCLNINLNNGVLTVLLDLLKCLVKNLNSLSIPQIGQLLLSLLKLKPVLTGVGDLLTCLV
ncbi:hypothetical protein FQR65_LT11948 [Abscondita terminalis]|nr:hypothetical protein FQR65_LT11948 [Abscondita terminalis]